MPRIIPRIVIAGDVMVGEFARGSATRLSPIPDPGSSALASPKSSTFTTPSARSLMLAGLRSRWMIPCSCAASSASAICLRDRQRLVEGQRAAGEALRQILALDQLHHQRATPPLSSRPWMWAMFGWFSAASVWASRVNRASRSASLAKSRAAP